MKKLLLIIILIALFRSGFAQSPNGFDIVLDKNLKELRALPCGDEGFCLVSELKSRKFHQLSLSHYDTLMKLRREFTLPVPPERRLQEIFYEHGTVVVLCRTYNRTRITGEATLLLYRTADGQLDSVAVTGLPEDPTVFWHHYKGNTTFVSKGRSGERVWFLPAGETVPYPFTFTQENPGSVLTTAVDTAHDKAVICFTSGGRTMYFETDFRGQSSFANILNEPATHAQWIPVGREHSLLMLYLHNEGTFYMHPVNILNHKVTPSETVYCAEISASQKLPEGVKNKQTVIIPPYSYINYFPSYSGTVGDRVFCITELYYAEYYNYFNGWYVEPRFNGYRYERADVHLFDTNGVFQTNVVFTYDESTSLHTRIYNKLKICPLQSNILLYSQNAHELTTMLIDANGKVKSPLSTVDLPVPLVPFKNQRILVDRLDPWYGGNRFLFTAYRINMASQQKIGYQARKLEYQ